MVFDEKFMVLVVNDNQEELRSISKIFEEEGYEVTGAMTYEQLLFCLEDEKPDIVVMDFRNAVEKIRDVFLRVRSDQRFLEFPVLGLFGDVTAEDSANYYEMGMDSICSEPFSKRELLIRSEHLVELVHKSKELEKKSLAMTAVYEEVKTLKIHLKNKLDEIEKLKDTIKRVAILDSVTGLYNRSYALEQLEMAVSRFNRKEILSSVILCNVDHFKGINNEFGHNSGDRLLKELAASLTKNKRNQDIIARFSGDTFIIVLPDTDIDGAKFFAERARAIVEQGSYTDKDIETTMTFGVMTYNQPMSVDMIMKMTEDALKFGKESGRNKIVIANELLNML